jgi:Zn-dependent protease
MVSSQSGSFRFFRFRGVDVFVHWSWFLAAYFIVSTRANAYSSMTWNVIEYLGLFLIVLLHEFGHVFACRQVGGVSNEIVLWPLGGVALGRPPQRPGAELWTIAAGPLVNVVLIPVLLALTWVAGAAGWTQDSPDLRQLLVMVNFINVGLLIFNVLPIYPLDGGQILRSLLWYGMGPARSLHLACVIGLVGIAGFSAYRLWQRPESWLWTLLLAFFIGSQCFAGLKRAQALLTLERMPRHRGFACPSCRQPPPGGPIWICASCNNRFDAFSTRAVCPHCQTTLDAVTCVHCGERSPLARWDTNPAAARDGRGPVIDV